MTSLGNLVRVDPRTVWKHEAHEFTPWRIENIDRLRQVLGLKQEVVEREASVGDFSVDILARDLGRDRLVGIENQLEPTDHSHPRPADHLRGGTRSQCRDLGLTRLP
jgi:hypothetical protein